MKKRMFGLLIAAMVLVLAPLVAQARTAPTQDKAALEDAKTQAGSNEIEECIDGRCATHNNRTPLTEDRPMVITQVGDVLKDTGRPGKGQTGEGSAVKDE